MKTSAIIALLAAFASAELLKSSCSSQCVEKINAAGGCARNDFECLCAKPGLVRQLQPCLESACSEADELFRAKVAFTQECKAAGVKISFVEPAVHLDMVRRADGGSSDPSHAGMAGMAGMGSGAGSAAAAPAPASSPTPTVARPVKADSTGSASGAYASSARVSGASRASATSKGIKPAAYTGAAAPRDIAGSMFGFVAAVAAAAAI